MSYDEWSKALVLVITASCNTEVCKYFSHRGNGIMKKLPGKVHPGAVYDFIKKPCGECGEWVRATIEYTPQN
jgi:hypothetical protein